MNNKVTVSHFWPWHISEFEIDNVWNVILAKKYRKFYGKLVPISFESYPFLVKDAILYAEYLSN